MKNKKIIYTVGGVALIAILVIAVISQQSSLFQGNLTKLTTSTSTQVNPNTLKLKPGATAIKVVGPSLTKQDNSVSLNNGKVELLKFKVAFADNSSYYLGKIFVNIYGQSSGALFYGLGNCQLTNNGTVMATQTNSFDKDDNTGGWLEFSYNATPVQLDAANSAVLSLTCDYDKSKVTNDILAADSFFKKLSSIQGKMTLLFFGKGGVPGPTFNGQLVDMSANLPVSGNTVAL